MDIQMSNGPGAFKVSIKLVARELSPSIASNTGYAVGVAMDLHPTFKLFVRAEGFGF